MIVFGIAGKNIAFEHNRLKYVKNKVCCCTKNITIYTLFQRWCDYCDIKSTSLFTMHGVNSNTEITCYEDHACRKILKERYALSHIPWTIYYEYFYTYLHANGNNIPIIYRYMNKSIIHALIAYTYSYFNYSDYIGYFSIAQVLFM